MWPLRAACPQWRGYTEVGSAENNDTWRRARERGYLGVFNTAVTSLSVWGDLANLEAAFHRPGCPTGDGWRARLRIAVAFLRAVAFLHDGRRFSAIRRGPRRRRAQRRRRLTAPPAVCKARARSRRAPP